MCEILYGVTPINPGLLHRLCQGLTHLERTTLLSKPLPVLLVELFGGACHDRSNKQKKRLEWRKNLIRRRITAVRTRPELRRILASPSVAFATPEWEIPKGRRTSSYESPVDTARREFEEESGYTAEEYVLHRQKHIKFVEEYVSHNGVRYHHTYFIGVVRSGASPRYDPLAVGQFNEISNVAWFGMREALAILRPEQTTKRRCVQSIFQYVEYMRQTPTTAIPTSARMGAPPKTRGEPEGPVRLFSARIGNNSVATWGDLPIG